MEYYKWKIVDDTPVPCQKDPGDQTRYYYAKSRDNTCEDILDEEKVEATCIVKVTLKFSSKEDFELYKKNLNDIREISGWRKI